jgi:MFS family permease
LVSGFSQLIPLRLVAGLGMAFVFAPGVALIAKYFGHKIEGFGVGVYNAVFYLGGALGLFGWAIFAHLFGWRLSLLSSGAIGIGTGLVMLFAIPVDDLRQEFSVRRSALVNVLRNGSLILLGVELFMITGGTSLVTAIMVYYLEGTMQVNPALAGLIAGLALILALAASPLAGRNYDRHKQASKLLFVSGVVMSFGLMLAAIATILGATLSTLIVGFCSGVGTTVGFSAAREVQAGDEYEALAVGWVNSLQLSSGFIWPIVFSFIVVESNYMMAWLIAGFCTLLLALGTFALEIRRRGR